jgi:hypothetical protein
MVSIGSINPVDSFAGIMEAARMGIRIPMPGIPALVNPIRREQRIMIAHCNTVKLDIKNYLPA